MNTDLFVALAQRRFRCATVAGIHTPAWKCYLTAVMAHAFGALGQNEIVAVFSFLDRNQDGCRLIVIP